MSSIYSRTISIGVYVISILKETLTKILLVYINHYMLTYENIVTRENTLFQTINVSLKFIICLTVHMFAALLH